MFVQAQRSENESSGSIHFRHAPKHAKLRLRCEPNNQNSVISYRFFKTDAPRALVFRPRVTGNEGLGTRLKQPWKREKVRLRTKVPLRAFRPQGLTRPFFPGGFRSRHEQQRKRKRDYS